MSTLSIAHIFVVAFGACLLWAVWTDVRTRTIPNAVSLAVVALYAGFALAGGVDGAWWVGPAVAAAILVAGMGCFAMGWFGGGDVKLLAACGLWAGTAQLMPFLLVTALVGAVLALLTLAARARPIPYLTTNALFIGPQTDGRAATADGIPYGLAIAAGGLWILYRMLAG